MGSRGKTYEERYGVEKALEIRKKMSLAHKGKRSPRKGRTYEDIVGIEKSKEWKNKQSEKANNMTDEHKQKISQFFKGKTLEEIHGKKEAKRLRELKSGDNSVMKRPEVKEKMRSSKKGSRLSLQHKKNISNSMKGINKGKTYEEIYGTELSKTLKRNLRLKMLKRIEDHELNGGQLKPGYNPKGCQKLNEIMEQTNVHIQHAENGGEFHIKELGYWVDGYNVENNIVYEYDEKHHFDVDGNLKEKDLQRQNEITEFLGCEFMRIKE